MEFIALGPYQVFIMGHSCGNSDRTLLNTLFEHDNCLSIKVFYRQYKDGTDNYIDLGSSSNLVVISFLFQLSSSFLILLKVVDMFAF